MVNSKLLPDYLPKLLLINASLSQSQFDKKIGKQIRRAKSLAETVDGFVLHQIIHRVRLIKAQKRRRNHSCAKIEMPPPPSSHFQLSLNFGRLDASLIICSVWQFEQRLRVSRLCFHATFVKGSNAICIFSSIKPSTITHSPWTDLPH